MFKFFLVIPLFVVLFLIAPNLVAASNSVKLVDDTIWVEAKYRVEPADPKVIAALQQALDEYYNNKTFIYKCYYVKFTLTIDKSKYGSGEENIIKVINTSGNKTASQAYKDYGMYTYNDWGAYDAANGSSAAAECGSFLGGKYNVDCATKAQWFFDSGYRSPGLVALGYSTGFYPPDFSGTNNENGAIYISDEVTSQILAHEIGHNLGFYHPFNAETTPAPYPENTNNELMYPFAPQTGQTYTNIPFGDLHEMLDNMNLECRWLAKVDNCQISGGVKTAITYNIQEKSNISFKIVSHDLSLKGGGDKKIDSYQNNPEGGPWACVDQSASPGKFDVSGSIESLPTKDFPQAFNLKLKNKATTQASEFMMCHTITGMYFEYPLNSQYFEWGLSAGTNTSSYTIYNNGRSFDSFNVQLGDPADFKKILNSPLDFDKASFYPQSSLTLTTDNLYIESIERFQRPANNPD